MGIKISLTSTNSNRYGSNCTRPLQLEFKTELTLHCKQRFDYSKHEKMFLVLIENKQANNQWYGLFDEGMFSSQIIYMSNDYNEVYNQFLNLKEELNGT